MIHNALNMVSTNTRPAIPVRAIKEDDPANIKEYPSCLAAKKDLAHMVGVDVCHTAIKLWAQKRHIRHGFKWELVPSPITDDNIEHGVPTGEPKCFTFYDCVEDIFNGGKVRVTDENPRRVSVFDLIEVVTGVQNPRMAFENMCKQHAEVVNSVYNFCFPGAGQRATPVTTAEGALHIVNLLPGKRAALFRKAAMQTLVRFLAGDPSMHEELVENAKRQQHLPVQHPMRAFTEAVYANPAHNRYIMHSPAMQGKFISQFYNRQVVYLLQWEHEGKPCIKVGWSDNFAQRIKEHANTLVGCKIWCVIPCQEARRVEQSWKHDFSAFNHQVYVQDKLRTEIFAGLDITEAELHLQNLCEEYTRRDTLHMERMRMDHELALKQHELELKRIELQILQTQLSLCDKSITHEEKAKDKLVKSEKTGSNLNTNP